MIRKKHLKSSIQEIGTTLNKIIIDFNDQNKARFLESENLKDQIKKNKVSASSKISKIKPTISNQLLKLSKKKGVDKLSNGELLVLISEAVKGKDEA